MKSNVVIVGAGISGLTLAWVLRKSSPHMRVTIVETSTRPGGWIQTIDKDGYLFELGPRSFRSEGHGQATLQLIDELGLTSSVIEASSSAHQRYLWVNGRLQQLPTGLWSFVTSPLTRSVARSLLTEWLTKPGKDDESIHSFASRRLGSHAADVLFDAMTIGIFAGDSRQLSMRSCFPTLYHWEQTAGSLTKGFLKYGMKTGRLLSMKNGMEEIVKELEQRLRDRILYGESVASVSTDGVTLLSGRQLPADHTYLAIPARAAAALLGPSPDALAHALREIPFASVTTVNCGFATRVLPREGFGYLVPTKEKEEVLGMVWDSSAFPDQNRWADQTRLTVMLKDSIADPTRATLEALNRHLGVAVMPDVLHIHCALRAIPQYTIGHQDRLNRIQVLTPPHVTFLGNSYNGISVNECIANAVRP